VSRWLLDFVGGAHSDADADADSDADASIAGFVRLELRAAERIAWYWAYLVGVPDVDGVLVVRDHEVLLPRRTQPEQGIEIRADGLWAELVCETPREHWTFGLESFGVRLDAPEDALLPGGEIGDRVAVGLDLEWEVGADGPPGGVVHGDVLVGRARYALDGRGWFYDDGTPDPGAVQGVGERDVMSTVLVPHPGGHVERRLVRTTGGPVWSLERREDPR